MSDATALRLAQVLKFNGSAVIDDRASLQRLLAPGQAQIPADIAALLLMLDTKAVAHLFKWARTGEAGKPSYTQMRDHIALKYEQAGKLSAATAAWALDAWMNAVPELQRAMTPAVRDLSLEALPPPPPPAMVPAQAPGSSPSNAPTPQHARSATLTPARAANPYAPPEAHVDDVPEFVAEPNFIENGRSVSAGQGVQWFVEGWRLFARHPLMWWVTLIVFLLVSMVIQLIPLAGPIIGWLLANVFFAGLMLGAHAVRQGEPLSVGTVFAGFKDRTGSLVLLSLLMTLVYAGAVFLLFLLFRGSVTTIFTLTVSGQPPTWSVINSMLGLVVVALLLFIPLGVVYYLSPALVAINGCGPLTAINMSFRAAFKNVLPGIVYMIVFTLAAILATLPVGLGWLVLAPMVLTSVYAAYRDIFYSDTGESRPSAARKAAVSKRLARTLTPAANVPVARAPEDR